VHCHLLTLYLLPSPDTMKAFRDFVKGFKPKYRIAHDRSLGLPTASPAVVEVLLYESYLRRMQITGEVNLNLDCLAEFVVSVPNPSPV
jgi:hypothetical protein